MKSSAALEPKQEAGAMDKLWPFLLPVKSLYILRTSVCTSWGKDNLAGVGHSDGTILTV